MSVTTKATAAELRRIHNRRAAVLTRPRRASEPSIVAVLEDLEYGKRVSRKRFESAVAAERAKIARMVKASERYLEDVLAVVEVK